MKKLPSIFTIVLSLLFLLLSQQNHFSPGSIRNIFLSKNQESNSAGLYPVTRVIDGDTIEFQKGAKKETIRLLGINTPETVDPRKPVECFGKEASAKTHELVGDKTVRIETDPSQNTHDKYGRLLAYVFLQDGTNINKTLITDGYAYEYTYDRPYRFQTEFKQAQKEAEEQQKGLWAPGVCEK